MQNEFVGFLLKAPLHHIAWASGRLALDTNHNISFYRLFHD